MAVSPILHAIMSFERILVLEDDLIVRKGIEQHLRQRRYEVLAVDTLAAAQDALARDSFDLAIVDVRLPDGEGTDLLRDLQDRPQKPLVIVISGFGSVDAAVKCIRAGAFDYLIKPFTFDQLEITLRKAENYIQLLKVNQHFSHDQPADAGGDLLGESAPMQQLRQLIRKVARTQATVLIQGESGTGKELVARSLYLQSPRANSPFIKLNCAAVPENLIESEFFGHEKGSFTGALAKREGRFELAHGGTILLDEISEISLQIQAKLLRVLQERELERVGGNRTIKVDVRVIATTNRHLEESVNRKEFRQDLFFRLNVVPIHVPPLRERPEDIPLLAAHFTQRLARKHGVRVRGISDPCLASLHQHPWPGNIRELQNVIERAVILCGDSVLLEPEHLGLSHHSPQPEQYLTTTSSPPTPPTPASSRELNPAPNSILPLEELEKRHIFTALDFTNGNRTQAARLLGISIRTLRNKLNDYGQQVRPGDDAKA
jgi:DNA-binding NtrC family response regulator